MDGILDAALKLAILAFSVVVHEVAHGYVAYRLGDPTAKLANRLTLNPLDHIDLMGSILVPLLLLFSGGIVIGWAKPVPVDPRYFRNPRRDEVLVSVAGVFANLVLAVIAAAIFRLLGGGGGGLLHIFLMMFCIMNVVLAVFNLIPIPPLDGSHVLAAALPADLARIYMSMAPYGFFLILALLYFAQLGGILGFIVRTVSFNLLGISS